MIRYVYDETDSFKSKQNLYYMFDDLGSVTAITDDTGTPVQMYMYDAYGNVTNTQNDPINNFAFVGRYGGFRDWDTGLTQFLHRWYDSKDGRWLSRDPIGVEGGINLYNYTDNNPVNVVDALGMCGEKPNNEPKIPWCFTHVFIPCLAKKVISLDGSQILTGELPGYAGPGLLALIQSHHEAQAFNHVLKSGLTSWNKSSIYRELIKKAKFMGKLNIYLSLGMIITYEVQCIKEEVDAYYAGECKP